MTRPEISSIAPLLIVHNTTAAISFYRDQLGFEITFQEPAEDPFFGIVQRDGAMIMLKDVGVAPVPNHKQEPGARWDAYLYVKILMPSRPNLSRAMSNFQNHSKTLMMGCVASSSRTQMVTSCSSAALDLECVVVSLSQTRTSFRHILSVDPAAVGPMVVLV